MAAFALSACMTDAEIQATIDAAVEATTTQLTAADGVGTPLATAAPITPTPTSLPVAELIDIETRVTEQGGNVWWRFAYRLTIRNNSDSPLSLGAKIEWQDADGFIIDSTRERDLLLAVGQERTFTGDKLISLPGARNVSQVFASLNR